MYKIIFDLYYEKFKFNILIRLIMPKNNTNENFQSGAGLIRYFNEEEIKGPALDPKLIIYIGIAMAVIVELAKIFWPVS